MQFVFECCVGVFVNDVVVEVDYEQLWLFCMQYEVFLELVVGEGWYVWIVGVDLDQMFEV